MPNTAVLVANSNYRLLTQLECCMADLAAMKELLDATGKYDTIDIIENANANDLKERIRASVEKAKSPAELFFYYSGHGHSFDDEFFYCATNFDPKRPNETGLSTTDLHTLLRLADSELVVKIVDACNSGTFLVKADIGLTPQNEQGFRHFLQISSCLDTQSSLTGHPLSLFTEKFRNAALSKTEGAVYYMDLVAVLRDQFISNDTQIPFFVSQFTGREYFTDDASKLDKLREAAKQREAAAVITTTISETSPTRSPTTAERLMSIQSKLATAELVSTFTGTFFDSLKEQVASSDLAEYFDIYCGEHDDFREATARRFIIEVLSREKRADNFVTAEMSGDRGINRLFGNPGMTAMVLGTTYSDKQHAELYDLTLNCKMARAQLVVALTPKFSALHKILLVVTCVPSLETCYVFEVVTEHMLRDFGSYDRDGTKHVQRWYKCDWTQSTNDLVRKICDALKNLVQSHVESALKRFENPN